MKIHARNSSLSEALHRLVAAGCAGLVLLLGLMVVNPVWHDLAHSVATETESECAHHQHGTDQAPADRADDTHDCAVTLFAQGLALTAAVIAPEATPLVWHEFHFPVVEEQLLTTPRYLHQPERGPPLV